MIKPPRPLPDPKFKQYRSPIHLPPQPSILEIMSVTPVNRVASSFIGNLLNALCFGVLTIQTSSYYRAFPNDGRPMKLVVGFLWILEAFQISCSTQSLYWWVVTNYHNPLALNRPTWEFSIFHMGAVCASVTVQTFFVYRVYSLSANPYLGALVQVLVLLQFGFGIAAGAKLNMTRDIEVMHRRNMWVAISWMTIQAVVDILIATWLCLVLRHRRTGFQKTDSVINRMIMYSISTGLVTSVLSCILLGMVVKYGLNVSIIIGMPLGGFYSITILANLHMRKRLRARLDTPSLFELVGSLVKKTVRGMWGILKAKRDSRRRG
ncbi:hypothetical protein BS47DRAFT_389140 [Hydnum rufescens UP504]|uniref:DUF6534 domain-containing protein n=1 Tax=Hydnum rufescens UP504 TaxID=1448309 RepID=A0A9P6AJT7_9AGAM|nr:hypothetical protein BS47DRAFT_389140 [Hydnum rufescens UP504]